jgi:hypothetical protein
VERVITMAWRTQCGQSQNRTLGQQLRHGASTAIAADEEMSTADSAQPMDLI